VPDRSVFIGSTTRTGSSFASLTLYLTRSLQYIARFWAMTAVQTVGCSGSSWSTRGRCPFAGLLRISLSRFSWWKGNCSRLVGRGAGSTISACVWNYISWELNWWWFQRNWERGCVWAWRYHGSIRPGTSRRITRKRR
jgi:hypothetical protein